MTMSLKQQDSAVWEAMQRELKRQAGKLEMIASENFVSPAVLEALGSVLTNKYAEGYPGKRYYGGCEHVDEVENLAIDRVKRLFGADYANVQPHSGSNANMAAYFAFMKPGDTLLSMNLAHGGHLTHGSPVNFTGKLFNVVHYGVRQDTCLLDYDEIRDLAKRNTPKVIMAGFSAYPRKLDFAAFRSIADEVGAVLIADIAHPAGLVAAKLYPDPIPYCDVVTSTTHKTLRGPRGGLILAKEAHGKALNSNIFPGIQGGPLMHVIAAKAVAFEEALRPDFVEYQRQTLANAQALAKGLMARGFTVLTGGTDCHLMLLDLSNKNLTGKVAEQVLDSLGITVNKNMVPFDKQSPFVTSGIRLGSPALTTRGFTTEAMLETASCIADVLENIEDEGVHAKVRARVAALCSQFPLYGDLF